MILDARRDPPRQVDCDVCIVGGGPTGLALAMALEDQRRSIVVLESGGRGAERGAQALISGEAEGYPPPQATHLAALGGSTQVWAGWCRPLDAIDFESRDGVPNGGWPFGREALSAYTAQAHDLLALGDDDYSAERWAQAGGVTPPVPEDFAAALFRQSKGSFVERHAARLQASASLRVWLHATALRIEQAPDGRHANGIVAAVGRDHRFPVRCRHLVLAAGGIETARLLLLSGNAHPLVGRHFTEHLFVEAGRFVPARAESAAFLLPRAGARAGWTLPETRLRSERLLNGAIYLNPTFVDPGVRSLLSAWDMLRGRAVPHALAGHFARALLAPHRAVRALGRRLRPGRPASHWPLRALFECASVPDNRIVLGDRQDALGRRAARVLWRPQDEDLRSVMRTHALLDRSLRASGLGHLELPPPEATAWRECVQPALHHLGTARMHENPRHGVVDAQGRVHGVDNLYVAGGAVFPTGGYANPTLTMLALALRLAAHLRAVAAK